VERELLPSNPIESAFRPIVLLMNGPSPVARQTILSYASICGGESTALSWDSNWWWDTYGWAMTVRCGNITVRCGKITAMAPGKDDLPQKTRCGVLGGRAVGVSAERTTSVTVHFTNRTVFSSGARRPGILSHYL